MSVTMSIEEARRALNLCESETRAACMIELARELPDEMVKDLLTDYWTVMEAWGGSADRHEMLEILHRVGYISDTKKKPRLDRKYPGYGLVEIWRGNIGEDPREGFCWSTEMATAEFFARSPFTARGWYLGLGRTGQMGEMKEGAVATVWMGWVRREDILGYFVDRGEHEVIVDPDTIVQYDWYSRATATLTA